MTTLFRTTSEPGPEAKFARKNNQVQKLVNFGDFINFTYQKQAFWLPCDKFSQGMTCHDHAPDTVHG